MLWSFIGTPQISLAPRPIPTHAIRLTQNKPASLATGTTIRAVSVFDRRPVFTLGTRHEVTACVGMRGSHAALGGAVLCTTRCRQRADGRWGGAPRSVGLLAGAAAA